MQSIGFMSETMQRDLFEKELPKMINIFMGMYQREKNHLPITQVRNLTIFFFFSFSFFENFLI